MSVKAWPAQGGQPQGMICMTLSFARAVLISYSCLLEGELQENRTTHAVPPKFCLAKPFPSETSSPREPKADCCRV